VAGASFAVNVIRFADNTVIQVDASPLWSVSSVQLAPPEHAENAIFGDEENSTLAPATGVFPSATTNTVNGKGACAPTGVAGFVPAINFSLSFGPAPTVSTLLISELPPEFTSLSWTSYTPSATLGVSTSKRVADDANTGVVKFAT
jgi:hypothetical protein